MTAQAIARARPTPVPRLALLALGALFALGASGCDGERGATPDTDDRVFVADAGRTTAAGDTAAGSTVVGDTVSVDGVTGTPPAVDPVITRDPPPPDDATTGGSAATATDPVRRTPPPAVDIPAPDDRPVFERPEHVRGIYLNAWTAGSPRRIESLVDLARRTEINAFVIDVKDATGQVSYATGVEAAREVGAASEIRIGDLPGLLRRLEREGIYPIARIVIVKDAVLAGARPELAVQDTAGGPWHDSRGVRWLNLFDERVVQYHFALAREAVALGFPEVQWDYVRFADAPRADLARAHYPGREGRTQVEAVRDFLSRSRGELDGMGAHVTADVFGVTTSAGDIGIGQVWEEFIDVVDAALPMVYPSHYYTGSFGVERPNARPYEIVKHAIGRAVRRSEGVEGAGRVIPWLQDFSLGEPGYGAPEVRAQIQAVYDVGVEEWLLWNPGSRYTEDALQPAEGWREEPFVRVADEVVPVSRRQDALERERERARHAPPDSSSSGSGG